LLGIEHLSAEQITFLLDQSKPFQEFQRHPLKKLATLRGKTVALAFFEPSTRTRISFATAASRLGADTMNLQAEASSLRKGESLLDTVRTLDAMKPDAIVIRHSSSGAADFIAQRLEIPVLNAGDGTHEHPTQALLDALTIRDRKGRLDGWNVTILGDILHSRVARSNMHLLSKFGSRITLCGRSGSWASSNASRRICVEFPVSKKPSTAPTSSSCCASSRNASMSPRSRLRNTSLNINSLPNACASRILTPSFFIPAR
jgi:aspartate carbamoyltransferase catalytic subunit